MLVSSPFSHFVSEFKEVMRLASSRSSQPLPRPQSSVSLGKENSIWESVDSEVRPLLNSHHEFWWTHGGLALAFLLYYADYSPLLQYVYLRLFANVVAPSLGVAQSSQASDYLRQYSSFMTDDGTPIELSWDWGYGDPSTPPLIRYSVEPISLNAGTILDKYNEQEGNSFHDRLVSSISNINLEWFRHFHAYFQSDLETGLTTDDSDHSSRIFYAFDLSRTGMTSKAYFFPRYVAKSKGISVMETILEAISSAPQGDGLLGDFYKFRDYVLSQQEPVEMDMLAIDMINPIKSRVKIYFRTRQTDFESVRAAMSLGGRLDSPQVNQGLDELRDLWNSVFNVDTDDTVPLGDASHRTAGILYNVEFKATGGDPVTKIYLPVRHYGVNDEAILRGLCTYMARRNRGDHTLKYTKMMESIL